MHILITGASSGIGEALAFVYAAPGVHLSLSGRDAARLEAVVAACRSKGAVANGAIVDAADEVATTEWIKACDAQAPLDLVVANAGISGGMGSHEQTRRILRTNVDGVVNTVLPAVDVMRPRKRGQIAIVSSLAGFRGLGGAPAYGASKAAVRVWGEGLRPILARDGIGMSVVCPGFVVSRMTDVNKFHMPFLMDTDKAARIIQRGLTANKGRISFPWPMAFVVWLLSILPNRLAELLTHGLPDKN